MKASPSTGTFGRTPRTRRHGPGRLAYSPFLGQRARGLRLLWAVHARASCANESVWSLGPDGLFRGPFEIEGEFVYTQLRRRQERRDRVSRSVAVNGVSETENPDLNTEVEFELVGLATHKHGYWLEAALPLVAAVAERDYPRLVLHQPAVHRGPSRRAGLARRPGQGGRLSPAASCRPSIRPTGFVNRITPGLAYRPMPLVVFQLAYEFT